MDDGLIIIFISMILLILGIKFWQKGSDLMSTGKVASAIVFKNNFKSSGSDGGIYYPVVRFLTEQNEWITEELDIGQNPPLDEGKKLIVIYDPENPSNFDIKSTFRQVVLPRILVAVGSPGIMIGLLIFAEIISL